MVGDRRLPQGQAAVIGRHALVPEHLKPGPPQALDRQTQQQYVLKDAARSATVSRSVPLA